MTRHGLGIGDFVASFKGDTPGHPFRGNQWSGDDKSFISDAEVIANAAGVDIDKNGYSTLRKFMGKNAADQTPALFLDSTNKIHINEKNGYWKNPSHIAKQEYSKGNWSSDDPMHVVNHEVAHGLQYKADARHFDRLKNQEIPQSARESITKNVSKYAVSSPREFVGEVYAGMKAGKTYDDNVMRLYRQWNGPKS